MACDCQSRYKNENGYKIILDLAQKFANTMDTTVYIYSTENGIYSFAETLPKNCKKIKTVKCTSH